MYNVMCVYHIMMDGSSVTVDFLSGVCFQTLGRSTHTQFHVYCHSTGVDVNYLNSDLIEKLYLCILA